MSLLTIGTVAFDALETPYGKTDKIIGGSCTYIALSAAFFLPKVNVVAVVGDDFLLYPPSVGAKLKGISGVSSGSRYLSGCAWL